MALPTIGDLQTLTYRNDVYADGAPKTWDEVIAKGKAGVAAGKIKYPVVFRGVSGNPIVSYNAALRDQVAVRGMDLVHAARMFAAVDMTVADALITVWHEIGRAHV